MPKNENTTKNAMQDTIDSLTGEYWELHNKLGSHAYKSHTDQISDMVKLARIADALNAQVKAKVEYGRISRI